MNKEILQKAIDTYGEFGQVDKFIEESAELIQALLKTRKYQEENDGDYTEGLYNSVLTEVADVYITLEYIKRIYKIPKTELNSEIEFKLKRLKERLENDE